MSLTPLIGLTAAICTTVSCVPQLEKCWTTGSAGDLSLRMFLILATGITLWVVYGMLQGDRVIILANAVSLCFLAGILYFKLREPCAPRGGASGPPRDAAETRRPDGGAQAVTVGRSSA